MNVIIEHATIQRGANSEGYNCMVCVESGVRVSSPCNMRGDLR